MLATLPSFERGSSPRCVHCALEQLTHCQLINHTQLQIYDDDQKKFSIYRTEIGRYAIGQALTDEELMGLYRERGDERGSIKLLVSHSHASVHEPPPLPEPSQPSPTIHTITPPVLPQHGYPPLRPRRRSRSRRGSMSSASERLPPDQSAGYEASVSDDLDHIEREPRRAIRALPPQPSAPRQQLPQPPRPKSPVVYSRPLSPGGILSPDRARMQQPEVAALRPDWSRGNYVTTPPSSSPDVGRSQDSSQPPWTTHGRSGSDAALERERATQLIDFGPDPSQWRRTREQEDGQKDKLRRRDGLRKDTAIQRAKAAYDSVGSENRRRDDDWVQVVAPQGSSGYKKERPTTPQESRPSPSRHQGFGPFNLTMPKRPPPPPPSGEQRDRTKRQAGKAVPASYVISYKGPQKHDPPAPQSPPPPPFNRMMKSMGDLRGLYKAQGSTSQTQSGKSRQGVPLPLKPTGSNNSNHMDALVSSGSNHSEGISSSYHDSPLHSMEAVRTYDGPRYPALSPSFAQYSSRPAGQPTQSPPQQGSSNTYLYAGSSGQEPYPRPRSATGNGATTSPYRSNRTLQSPNNPDFPSPETPLHRPSPQGLSYYSNSTNAYRDDCYHTTGTGFGPRPIPSHSRHERTNTDNLGAGTFDYSTSRVSRTPPRSPISGKPTLDPKDSKSPGTILVERTLSSTLPVQEDEPSSAESTVRHDEYKHIFRMLGDPANPGSGSNTVIPSRPPLPYMSGASTGSSTLLNESMFSSTASSIGHDSVHSDDSDSEAGTIWAKAPEKSNNSSRPVLAPIDTESSPSSRPVPLPRENSRPPLPGYIPESPPRRRVNRIKGAHLKDQRTSRFDNNFDVTWAPRPPPEEVLAQLQDYFPEHDVDEPVIDAPSGGTSPTSTTAEPGPLPPIERRSRHKKSIRVVAAERRRIDRGSHVEPTANAGAALRKRNTKLWGSRLEEVPTHEQALQKPPLSSDGSPSLGRRKHRSSM